MLLLHFAILPRKIIFTSISHERLRYVRDNVLNKTAEGQEIIRLYYQLSPAVVKAMENNQECKEEGKEMIDAVLGQITEEAQ